MKYRTCQEKPGFCVNLKCNLTFAQILLSRYGIVKQELNDGERPNLYFYRDSHGNEVDLLVKRGRSIIPVEIKSAATFKTAFVKGIHSFRETAEEACLPGYVLYNGENDLAFRDTQIINPFRKDKSQAKFLDFKFR